MATALRLEDGEQLDERAQPAFVRRVRIQGYKHAGVCIRLQSNVKVATFRPGADFPFVQVCV